MRSPIRRSNKTSKHKQKGVVAIEFAIGFMAFWLMCMAWVEMSYMSYVSAICDVTIAQATRVAKIANIDAELSTGNGSDKTKKTYLSIFKDKIENSDNPLGKLVDTSKFHVTVRYISSVPQLVSTEEPCLPPDEKTSAECGTANNSAIAIYRITYNFNPTLTFFLDEETVFTREVIVVQEYERSEFEN